MALLRVVLALLASFPVLADQVVIQDYEEARDRHFYRTLYPDGGQTIYCEANFTGRGGLNVEHVYPASWMKETAGCSRFTSRNECRRTSDRFNLMEADLHNLYPALASVNQARSNYLFAIIGDDDPDEDWPEDRAPGGDCDFEIDRDADTVEPRPGSRGEVARAIFYIAFEYGAPIDEQMSALLLDWHNADPVSDEERRRNDVIEQIQNTRNPFIDEPRLARVFLRGDDVLVTPGEVEEVDCNIKGNISRRGKIYHTPESSSYNAVKIDTSKGERFFCSIADAEAAGWRAPR